MGISEYRATGGNKALLNEYHRKKDSAAVWYVNFDKYDDQKFGFDKYSANKNKSLYPYLTSDYDLRYKSIATSSSDKVKVTNFNKKDSIIFKDKYGVRLKLSDNNILNFSSQSTADTNYIYAYNGDKKVGFYFKKSKEIYEKLEPCKDAKGNDCFLKTIVEFKNGFVVDVTLSAVNNISKSLLNSGFKKLSRDEN